MFVILFFFGVDVADRKRQMEEIMVKWRAYKEEYEKLSDWLQGIENSIKSHKTTLFSTVPEKENQFVQVQVRYSREKREFLFNHLFTLDLISIF